jgi:hypothetical protein
VHLSIILVNDQVDARIFSVSLFQLSTRFEEPRAHHQENQLYQYNIWYVSLCVGDSLVCRSGRFLPDLHTRLSPTQSGTYQMYWHNWFSWWWARGCSKQVENWNKHIENKLVRQVGHLQELQLHIITYIKTPRFLSDITIYWTMIRHRWQYLFSLISPKKIF